MRLRSQLALAFLLLAVLPLAATTVHSYRASQRAFREAVDAEGRRLAEELSGRLERATATLGTLIERFRSRPPREPDSPFEKARQEAIAAAERDELAALLAPVLAEVRGREGAVPFALDAEGRLYASDETDRPTLVGLGLGASPAAGAAAPVEPADWLVVSHRDQESGLTIGLARPLGGALREIRNTAVRNLAIGLGVVVVALIGVVPLAQGLTRPLATLTIAAERVGRGEVGVNVPVPRGAELGRLARTFNRMSEDLLRQQERLLEQERLRKELEISRRIQRELLPTTAVRFGFGEVAGVSVPAREVGGDFFNYFPIETEQAALLIGDVSGKGVPAALLMANVQATLRARLVSERDLARLADRLDHELGSDEPGSLYLTLFVALVDARAGELRYVNAGHNPQLLLRPHAGVERLESSGRPPALYPGGGYAERRLPLAGGETLFLFTDGLVEAEDAAGEPFGDLRLEALLREQADRPVGELLSLVNAALARHRGEREADDDATLVALRLSSFAR